MSARTLDQIEADFDALDRLLEELEGDITGQEAALDAMVASLEDEEDAKLEGYRYYLQKLEARVQWKRTEEARLAARRFTEQGRIEWLKARLLTYVQASGGKIETSGGSFRAQKNAPSVEVLLPADELPAVWRRRTVAFAAETDLIRDALKAGVKLPFARFRAPSFHLRMR